MDVARFAFYQLGESAGRAMGCADFSMLVKILGTLGLGDLQIDWKNNRPVFRLSGQGRPRSAAATVSCFFQAGFLAGCLESFWRDKVVVEESRCLSLGDSCCEFSVAPDSQWPSSAFCASTPGVIVGQVDKVAVRSFLDLQKQWLQAAGMTATAGVSPPKRAEKNNSSSPVFTLQDLKGISQSMVDLKQMAARAARSDFTVLIQGESGTGKELLAQAIHHMSRRAQGPWISLNCAAVPENLWEAEFFGFEEGSFTGAKKGGNPGKLELAHGGTLFLDEIGDMPLAMQAKLLRVLQYGEVQKLGSVHRLAVDVRLIAASNKNLTRLVEEGGFREDLYYRLNVIRLEIPPLRERPEDIPVLALHILEKLSGKYPEGSKRITPAALGRLQQYVWPGNVRELENIMERAFSLIDGELIDLEDLLAFLPGNLTSPAGRVGGSLKESLAGIERELILEAIEAAAGNRTQAARILGLSRSTLHVKLKQHNIVWEDEP
ncbi:transcriptional regulatory protein ZraR [Peptococcaceae bacterium CEB3]|nr:transcriptional regulatory protein ZraR [Peptococcaceae bacterium CEB3]